MCAVATRLESFGLNGSSAFVRSSDPLTQIALSIEVIGGVVEPILLAQGVPSSASGFTDGNFLDKARCCRNTGASFDNLMKFRWSPCAIRQRVWKVVRASSESFAGEIEIREAKKLRT